MATGVKDMAKKAKCMADGGIINNAAEYWANDNAEFEKTNPNIGRRLVRAINPVTGFGSAMGAMHTAAGNGDVPGMAMAGISAIPAFGVMRTVPAAGAMKASAVPGVARSAAAVAGQGVSNAVSDEYQARQNPAYARGGIVRGKGGVDRVPMAIGGVNVNLTGGKKPEAVLPGKTVEAMGGPSAVESLIEATNGKPPVKGGLKEGGNYRYGANGEWIPDPEEDKAPAGGQPFGPAVPTLGQGLTGMSSAISGIGVSNPPPAAAPVNENYGNEGRSVPVPITKDRPGIVVDNNFNVAGNEYSSAPTSQPGVQRITAPGTSPLYTNIDRGAAVSGLNGQMAGGDAAAVQEGLNRYANANKIRGEMIDSSIQANGGNGAGVLQTEQTLPGGMSVSDWNNRVSAGFNTQMSPKQKAEYLANEGSMGIQRESQNVLRRGQDVQLMGSEMQARRAAAHDNTIMRGQDLTAAETAARLGIDKEKVKILQADSARLGDKTAMENAKTQGEIDDQKMLREARAVLTSAIASGDPRKIEQARTAAVAAGIKFDKPDVSADYKPDGMGMGGTAVQRSQDGSLITTRIGADGKVAPPVRIAAPGASQNPLAEYQSAMARAGNDQVKVKAIQDRARQLGIIQ